MTAREERMREFLRALADAFPAALSGGESLPLDQPSLETFTEIFEGFVSPDVECVMAGSPGVPPISHAGTEGLRRAWADWLGGFEAIRFRFEEVVPTSGALVVLAHQVGTTRYGVEIEQPSAMVTRFSEEGEISRVEFHLDRDEAMRSAGLNP